MQGRMTAADYRHGTGLGSYQKLQFPLSLSSSIDLDTRVDYDANGRIRGKLSGGVSSADSAIYHYYPNSYRVEHVSGNISKNTSRVTDGSQTFQYDVAGNMVEDRSKNMAISYGDDGMPTLIKADSVLRLRPLYDASGYRVSQAALRTFPEGYPDYWVGNPQTSLGDDFAYDVSTLDEALYRADTAMNIWNSPAPDSLVFFVVLDQGDTSMAPAWDSLTAIAKDDTLVPVRVYGMRKFSARYDSLRSLREGRLLAARHWVNLGGQVLGEVTEGYDSTETLVSSRLVAPLYGRGTPVGRVVHTDTGEVTQFYVKNHLGSTMRVVNVDGSYATTPTFDYQTYGELQTIREDSANPVNQKFTGKGLDTEVNLYYFGARWYDQELAMWIRPDPARQFFNPYSYGGNPISYVDPDGRRASEICSEYGDDDYICISEAPPDATYVPENITFFPESDHVLELPPIDAIPSEGYYNGLDGYDVITDIGNGGMCIMGDCSAPSHPTTENWIPITPPSINPSVTAAVIEPSNNELLHTSLDFAGFLPFIGFGFDALNAGFYFYEGNYSSGALSLAAALPVLGTAASFSKAGKGVGQGTKVFPRTVNEMERLLGGGKGQRIPDLPHTPGRDKVIFQPSDKIKIIYERHPYHPNAPAWHRGPHWHLDLPGKPHQRFLPGDPIPGY